MKTNSEYRMPCDSIGTRAVACAFLAVTLAGNFSVARADSASTLVPIATNVIANCISATTSIAFGNYDVLALNPTTATGSLVLTCTQDATPSVVISLGNNPSGGNRRMVSGTNDHLPYSLFTPISNAPNAGCAGASNNFPSAAPGFVLVAAPSIAPRTFYVCGQIASGINSPAGVYSDIVQATVSF